MATINVDIDLDDFDLDEILDELEDRYNSYRSKEKNQMKINDFIKKMKIDCIEYSNPKLSMLDEMKIDFLMNNLDKIKLIQLENLI